MLITFVAASTSSSLQATNKSSSFSFVHEGSSHCHNEDTVPEIQQLENICKTGAPASRLCRKKSRTLYVSHVCGCLLLSRIVFDICSRQICLGLVVFRDEKSTEARCAAEMWEGSWWGSLWLIFPLATWQGEDKALIMNCDTLMSLSSTDNTWSALLPFNLWYQ